METVTGVLNACDIVWRLVTNEVAASHFIALASPQLL